MFEAAIASSTERLQRVRALLHMATQGENPDLLGTDSEQVRTLRGLFFVMLYAYFEHSINSRVSDLLDHISKLQIPSGQFRGPILSIIVHSRFQAIEDPAGKGAPWMRRVQLVDAMDSEVPSDINNSIFGPYLQNIWHSSLVQVFECLGITESPVPNASDRGYIDELVEKRNTVAHGRGCASDVGRAYRSAELLLRLDKITQIVEHIERVFRRFAASETFRVRT